MMKKFTRTYYAIQLFDGRNTTWAPVGNSGDGGLCCNIFRFKTKKERDAWVERSFSYEANQKERLAIRSKDRRNLLEAVRAISEKENGE